jgi:histidyl-tRNA synthetase
LSDQPNPEKTPSEKTTSPVKFRAVRGVRDILPPETALWNRVEQVARDVFRAYGFAEIRLPIFEETQLFGRSIGQDTDVVTKEMYTFYGRGPSRVIALRDVITSWPLADKFSDDIVKHFVTQVDLFLESWRNDAEGAYTTSNRGEEVQAISEVTIYWNDLRASLADSRRSFQLANLIQERLRDFRSQEYISLRPEATASVVRAYIEHGMHTLPGDVKLYYIGPMFRRERPQKGRYRQFYQIGAEVLGQSDAPAVDAEVIEMLMDYFARLNLEGATLFVNSIGCTDCRPKYVETLRAALRQPSVKDKLGADSQRRIESNPLRVLDSKVESEQPIIETLPRIAEHSCESCRAHFAALKDELKLRGVAFEENWRLVRGLDYYTRTTFEITARGLGSQNAVCGGGRYDGLVEMLGGPPTKGIGFAIGLDRLILSLQEQGKGETASGPDVFIAWMGREAWPSVVKLARMLRDAGVSVELPADEMKFKKALGRADKLGARYALIIGGDEVASQQYTLKRLSDGVQNKFAAENLVAALADKSK